MSKFNEWANQELYNEGNHDLQPDDAAYMGWKACREEILKILKRPLQNADLSEDYCDSRYIEKIINL